MVVRGASYFKGPVAHKPGVEEGKGPLILLWSNYVTADNLGASSIWGLRVENG